MRHLLPPQTHCLRIQYVIDLILFLLLSLLIDKETVSEDLKTISEDLNTLSELPRVPCKSRTELASEPVLQVDPPFRTSSLNYGVATLNLQILSES